MWIASTSPQDGSTSTGSGIIDRRSELNIERLAKPNWAEIAGTAVRIDVVTLFPEMVAQAAGFGVTGRALTRGLWQLGLWNPREFTTDNHKTVDDRPYGGGPGMVMLAEPLAKAIAAARSAQAAAGVAATRVFYLSPAGVPLTHERVLALSEQRDAGYILLAGRYEGIDERLLAREADEEIAIDVDRCRGAPVARRAE
jgi:tRNA (guanine37-N1)-methyltransferase